MNTRIRILTLAGLLVLLGALGPGTTATAADDPHATAVEAFDLRLEGRVDEAVARLDPRLGVVPQRHRDAGAVDVRVEQADASAAPMSLSRNAKGR